MNEEVRNCEFCKTNTDGEIDSTLARKTKMDGAAALKAHMIMYGGVRKCRLATGVICGDESIVVGININYCPVCGRSL